MRVSLAWCAHELGAFSGRRARRRMMRMIEQGSRVQVTHLHAMLQALSRHLTPAYAAALIPPQAPDGQA